MRKQIWEQIKRVSPAIAMGMSIDSFINSRRDLYKDRFIEEALKRGATQEQAAKDGLREATRYAQELRIKYFASGNRLETAASEVAHYAKKINDTTEQIKTENNQSEYTTTLLMHYKKAQETALQNQSAAVKELQDLNNHTIDTEIFKSDLSEYFTNFIDTYREFLNTLTPEQLVVVVNI
jgi:DNA repair ATPase RecN